MTRSKAPPRPGGPGVCPHTAPPIQRINHEGHPPPSTDVRRPSWFTSTFNTRRSSRFPGVCLLYFAVTAQVPKARAPDSELLTSSTAPPLAAPGVGDAVMAGLKMPVALTLLPAFRPT